MLTKQQLEADVKRLEMAQGKEMVTVPWDIRRLKDVTHMALSSLSGGWRPIEEAPKDGTWVWLHYPTAAEEDSQVCGRWDEGCWVDFADCMEFHEPTHWMPRPASPPQVSQEGE